LADQNEHAQPDLEAWWNNYHAQVNESIVAAEQHLEVPAGTISSISTDPDFIATVKMYAVVEPILNELIASRPPSQGESENFRTFVTALNMEGRAGKLKLAEGMGLLTEGRIAFIRGVAQVRNRYAHNVKNMHRSLTDILTEEQRNNGRIVEHLIGIKFELSPSQSRNDLLKLLMYYRLADYLTYRRPLTRCDPRHPPRAGLDFSQPERRQRRG